MSIESLACYDIPQPLIDTWKTSGISDLTECQDRVLSQQSVWDGKNILVVAPTSSGKTFVGEVLAAKSAFTLKRAIFLVPFKAIAEEKYSEFKGRYSSLGISVVISDADHTSFDKAIRRGDFGIAVIVYEKMAQLLIQSPGILVNCSLIVVDEIQQISDLTRGPSLEILLTHIRKLDDQPQMVGLSATMSDLGGLDSWLDADVVEIQKRPVALWESIAYPVGSSSLENFETNESKPGLELASISTPQSEWTPGSKLDTTYRILMAHGLDKQALIFRTRVDDTASTAKDLAYVLPTDPVPAEVRRQIGELEETRVTTFLSQWIDKRVAYHNAGLALEERRLIERLFRDGTLRVLVTTSTLAAGVNTPADIVILFDYKRWNFAKKTQLPIPVTEYKNSAGRAGRFGISPVGHSYIIVDGLAETHLVRANYLLGAPATLTSSMPQASDVGLLTLGFLSLGLVVSEEDLRDSIRNSFAFHHYFSSDDERIDFLAQFIEALEDLEAHDLVSSDGGALILTDLGTVASSSGLGLESFYRLLIELRNPAMKADQVYSLLSIVCQLEECQSLRPYSDDDRAGLLHDWIDGTPVSQIIDSYSDRYEIGSGHIRTLGETAAWMLTTAANIAQVPGLLNDGELIAMALEDLAQRCRFGVPTSIVEIAELRVLQRSDLNLLVNNSSGKILDTPHKILDTELGDFFGILSTQKARRLQEAILDQISESIASRRFGHLTRSDGFAGLRPIIEACYDQQGIDLEVALEQLIGSQYIDLKINRFARQRTGQPDLEIIGDCGTIVIQVTASEDNRKPVSWSKAKEVLASVGYSDQASNFVTIARPDFHDVAIGNANEMAERSDQQLLLITISDVVELFLSEIEGKLAEGGLLRILESTHGCFVEEQE